MNPNPRTRDDSPQRQSKPNVQEIAVAKTLTNQLPGTFEPVQVIHTSCPTKLVTTKGIRVLFNANQNDLDAYHVEVTNLNDPTKSSVFIYLSREDATKHLTAFGLPPPGSNFNIPQTPAEWIHPETLENCKVLVSTRRRKLRLSKP